MQIPAVKSPLCKLRSLGRNPLLLQSLWSLVARFTGVMLNFAVMLVITHKLPKTPAGDIMLLMHFVTGVALISRLGIDQLLMKEVASAHDSAHEFRRNFLKTCYFAVFFLSLIFMVAWLVLSPWIRTAFFDNGSPDIITVPQLMLASSGILFFNLVMLNSTFLKAVKRSVYGVLSQNALPAVTFLLLIGLFWNHFADHHYYFNLYIASLVLAGIAAAWMTRVYLSDRTEKIGNKDASDELVVPGLIEIMRNALPLAPVSIVSFLMIFSDAILVGLFLPNDKVAEYSVAAKISFIILFFLQALEATIYPRLLNIYQHDKSRRRRFFWQSTALVIGVVFAVTLLMYLISDWLLLAFGKEYLAAKQVLVLLLIAQLLRSVSLTFSFLFIIRDKVKILNLILVSSLVVNIIGNIWLIQRYSIEGAALATLLANLTLVGLVLLMFNLKRLLPVRSNNLVSTAEKTTRNRQEKQPK